MKKLLLIVVLLAPVLVSAAPIFRVERSLLPETDSTYYLGTTTPSTRAWLSVITDQVCLTGDSCITSWPVGGGGGSGNVATSTNEDRGFLAYWTTTSGSPATLGEVATSSPSVTYPVQYSGTLGALVGGSNGAFSLAFGTTTSNTWGGTQSFTNTANFNNWTNNGNGTTTTLSITEVTNSLLKTNSIGRIVAAVAGSDYLASYDAWTHPYSGASATTSDIIVTGKVGVGTTTPSSTLDVLGTFSFDLFNSIFRKAEWNNLAYGESELLSGGTISFSGAADNWSVASTTAKVNGRFWSSDSINGTVATSTFIISGKSIKDPYIYKEGSTYYAFYTVVANTLAITDSDIGYATSSDLRNWNDGGVLINHTNWWGGSTLPTWAPSVIKVGSTYYMFVTTLDGGTFKIGYATSATLTGTYTFVDYVKDSGANIINYLDAHVIYYNGTYYMVAGNGNIKLWSTTSLAGNSWTDHGQILSISKNWETTDGVFEAPFLVPGTPTLLFYGASGSHDDQRIGVAVANQITGPYTKMGVDGQVLLDSPSEAVGPIDHPAIYYDKESSRWYLFASHGTTAGGHLYQRLAGYYSSDLANWQSIATSTQLKPSVTNYVYVNPAGQLMAAADLPYDSGRDGTFPERQGYLRLGSLTVNGSRAVTASSAYQGLKYINDWFGIGTTTPVSQLHISNGASATTTIDIGAISTSAKTCINARNDSGGAVSFFFHGTTMVVESGRCK